MPTRVFPADELTIMGKQPSIIGFRRRQTPPLCAVAEMVVFQIPRKVCKQCGIWAIIISQIADGLAHGIKRMVGQVFGFYPLRFVMVFECEGYAQRANKGREQYGYSNPKQFHFHTLPQSTNTTISGEKAS